MTSTARPIFHQLQFRRLGIWLAGILTLLLILALLSWAFLPDYVKRVASEQSQQQIGRRLDIDDIHFSPFRLALRLNGVRLYEADQKTVAVSLQELELNLSLTSLFHQALVIDELHLQKPELRLIRESAEGYGRYNFSDILDKVAAMPKSAQPMRFSIENIQVADGDIQFQDQVLHQQSRISRLNFGLPFVSNFPKSVNSFVEPRLDALINGSVFSLKARTKPFADSLETSLAIDLEKFDLTPYISYIPVALPVKVEHMVLSSRLDFIFSRKKNAELFLAGDIHLQDVDVRDLQASPLLRWTDLHAEIKKLNVMDASSELTKLRLQDPQIWLDIDARRGLNWANLNARSASPKKQTVSTKAADSGKRTEARLPGVNVRDIQIHGGQLHLSDRLYAKPAQSVEVSNIELGMQGFSTLKDTPAASLTMRLATGSDTSFAFDGEVQALSSALTGKVQINELALETYQAYLRPYLSASLSGKFNADAKVTWKDGQFSLNDGTLQLQKMALKGRSEEGGMTLSALALEQLQVDASARTIQAGQLQISGLNTDLKRDSQANLNLQNWIRNTSAATAAAPANEKTAPAPAWKLSLAKLDIKDSYLHFTDQSVSPAVRLNADGIQMQLSGFHSDYSQAMKLSLVTQMSRKARLNLNASIAPGLRQVALNIDAQSLPVAALYPYFSSQLNVNVNKGTASAKGKLNVLNMLTDKPQVAYDGMLSLNNFQIFENGSSEDFLEWKIFGFDGISAKINREQQIINLKKLSLNDFFARAVLSEKAQLNLQNIVVRKDVASQKEEVSGKAQQTDKQTPLANINGAVEKTAVAPTRIIRIAETSLSGGNVNFTDNFIKPNYRANLTGIQGRIGAIASDKPEPASIELNGKIDDDAPLLISGSLNPLSNPVFLDIKGSANGIELTRLTPYAAKYAGYAIDKGKLSMQVSYRIENQQLKAENDVTLDQLTFGERVDSPSATRLPVMLAVALLRDNDGKIAINLPVSGSLSDPQFSVGGIIFKVFVNLITKAVTSPFALLGSMFGSGEELAYVEFLPGASVLAPSELTKLDHLVSALKNRSGLKLDITGRVDPVTDADGLRQNQLESKLREAKWRDLHQKDHNLKLSAVNLTDDDRSKYIQVVYSAEKFTKPRNIIGLAKTLPVNDAEQLILKNLSVTDEDLRMLAQKRADFVRDYLEDTGKIQRERLFLIAPRLNADGIQDKGLPNRVDFSLK